MAAYAKGFALTGDLDLDPIANSIDLSEERGIKVISADIVSVGGLTARVWAVPPEELQSLRDVGLGFLRRTAGWSFAADANDQMLAYWDTCMAAYSFFSSVAEAASCSACKVVAPWRYKCSADSTSG